MTMKKIIGLLLICFCFLSVSQIKITSAAPELSQAQFSDAQKKANKFVRNKKVNFVFVSTQSDEIDGHFLADDIRTEAQIFWMSPFCNVMNEQLTQSRTGDRNFAALEKAGTMYQIRILLSMRNLNVEKLKTCDLEVTQGENVLTPETIRFTNLQYGSQNEIIRTLSLHKLGIVLDFAAADVTEKEPVTVKLTGDGGTPIIFKHLWTKESADFFDTKDQIFQWYPLHDTL